MTEGKLGKLSDAAFDEQSRHLKAAGAKTVKESCRECRFLQGKLEAFEEVRQAIKAERHKARKMKAKG